MKPLNSVFLKTPLVREFLVALTLIMSLGMGRDRAFSQTIPSPVLLPQPSNRESSLSCSMDRYSISIFDPSQPFQPWHPIADSRSHLLRKLALEYAQLGQMQQAIAVIETITSNDTKRFIWLRLAEMARQQNNVVDAMVFLNNASAIARVEKTPSGLSHLAVQLAAHQQVDRAVAIAHPFKHEQGYNINLQEIVFTLVRTEQFSQADRLVRTEAFNQYAKIQIWSTIVHHYFHNQPDRIEPFLQTISDQCDRNKVIFVAIELALEYEQYNSAIALLNFFSDPHLQDLCRYGIAMKLAENEQLERALSFSERIISDRYRTWVLLEIASGLTRSGQTSEALQALDRVSRLMETLDNVTHTVPYDPPRTSARYFPPRHSTFFRLRVHKYALLSPLALEYERLGERHKALAIVETMTNENSKITTLLELAKIARQRNNFADALLLLNEASAIASSSDYYRLYPPRQLAAQFAAVGHVDRSLAIARSSKNERAYPWILREIVLALVRTGQVSRAVELLHAETLQPNSVEVWIEIVLHYFYKNPEQIRPLLQTITDLQKRNLIISKTIGLELREEKYESAIALLDLMSDLMSESRLQDGSRYGIAMKLAIDGQFERSLSFVDRVESDWRRSDLLLEIASVLRKAGQYNEALQIIERARQLIATLENPPLKPSSNAPSTR